MKNPANRILKEMQELGLTLALAESVTCGMASNHLATYKGTSQVLKGSIICYTEEVKKSLLHIPQNMIDRYSTESKQVTDRLAVNLSGLFDADIYAAITGLASDGGSESARKPVGTIFISIYYRGKIKSVREQFRGTPLQIRKKASAFLFESIYKIVHS